MLFPSRSIGVWRVPVCHKCPIGTISRLCCVGVFICLLFARLAAAENVYPVAWHWPSNATAAAAQERFPWLRLGPERVNIDLSFDGGTTYEPLARGVDSSYGDNTWYFRLPDSPLYLTDHGRVRVSSLPAYRQDQVQVAVPVVIAGIHLVNPPAAVTNGSNVTVRWVAAGAGSLVQLGTRVIGAQRWVPQAVFASTDSNRGAITNIAVWSVSGLQGLPTEIVIQSLADPLNYRRHPIIVEAP